MLQLKILQQHRTVGDIEKLHPCLGIGNCAIACSNRETVAAINDDPVGANTSVNGQIKTFQRKIKCAECGIQFDHISIIAVFCIAVRIGIFRKRLIKDDRVLPAVGVGFVDGFPE